jgi:hypothetical protein
LGWWTALELSRVLRKRDNILKKIKINFVDFWPGFNKTNNYFFHLLSLKYEVLIDEKDPDILFFSVDFQKNRERDRYLNHRSKKIFYTGENIRPNFFFPGSVEQNNYSIGKCDFAFTFDFFNHPEHYRLPLWALYIDWFKKGGYENPKFLIDPNKIRANEFIDKPKDKFCCIMINNPETKRMKVFEKLSKYKKVDGYGRVFNRWSDGEYEKYKTISQYKFSICFENSISPLGGYYTEKLLHAKTAGNIPLYWADKRVENDFNKNSFINLHDFQSMDDFIEYIVDIDKSEEKYKKIFNEPLFLENKIKDEFLPENVLKFFEEKILC